MRTMLKLTKSEAKLFARDPFTVFFSLAFPIMFLFLLIEVFGSQPDPDFRGVGSNDYYVPAYMASTIAAFGLLSLSVHLSSYREQGVLRRLQASSVSPGAVWGAQLLVMAGVVSAGSALMVGIAFAFYDVAAPAAPAALLGSFLLGTAAFAAAGYLVAVLAKTARAAQGAGLLLFFGMFFISGAGPPPSVLPAGLRSFAEWLPLTHLVTALQDPWLGEGWAVPELGALLGLLVAALALTLGVPRYRAARLRRG